MKLNLVNGNIRLVLAKELQQLIKFGFQDIFFIELLRISMCASASNQNFSKTGTVQDAILITPLKR